MIRIDTKEAAQAWVESQRREKDAATDAERMHRDALFWMIHVIDMLYSERSFNN